MECLKRNKADKTKCAHVKPDMLSFWYIMKTMQMIIMYWYNLVDLVDYLEDSFYWKNLSDVQGDEILKKQTDFWRSARVLKWNERVRREITL